MRHRNAGLKIGRTSSHRGAMFRNMVTSLLKYDRIQTTDVKAKELRRWVDHIITLAKRGDLHARRQALAIVREKDVVHKLFEEVEERFGKVSGGYSRIVKIGHRPGDAAPMSLIELISDMPKSKKEKKKSVKSTKAGAPPVVESQSEPQKTESQAPIAEAPSTVVGDTPVEVEASADAEASAIAEDTPATTDSTPPDEETSEKTSDNVADKKE